MRAGIALGSNLGDRPGHLRSAISHLQIIAVPGEPFLVSAVYETQPIDCADDSPAFLNAAIEMSFHGTPDALLDHLQSIERQLGRPEVHERNAPRTIDLDILYFGDIVRHSPRLQIPHPRLPGRLFVIKPLADIVPHLRLPGHAASIQQICRMLESQPEPPVKQISERISN